MNTSDELVQIRRDGKAGASGGIPRDVEIERIRSAIKGIRFGEVRVIIQDGVVVQIEKIEKERLR